MRRTQRDASTHRRAIEKRSRERIGHSLKELKRLLPNFKQHGSKTGEQMDLLQSAVDYLKSIQTSSSVDHLSWSTESAKSTQSLGEGPLPSLFNPAPAPVDAMMDGYQDCMEETIRYLVQVEGFPPNHDIIIRLRAHLIQYQNKLDLNNQLRSTSQAQLTLDQYYDLQQRHQRLGLGQFVTHAHGGGVLGSSTTQTSPQLAHTNACAAYPPGSALLARRGTTTLDALHPKTLTTQGGMSHLPMGVMTPLTVDTNQYYAMPSPLAHCLSEGALARQGSTESLLTIARTLPTNTVTCSNSTTVGRTAVSRSVANPNPRTMHLPSSVQSAAPSVASTVSGAHLGFNLSYDAPYLVAFVRPAAQ